MEKFSSSKWRGGYQLHSVGGAVSIQGNSFLGVDKKLLQTSEEEVT